MPLKSIDSGYISSISGRFWTVFGPHISPQKRGFRRAPFILIVSSGQAPFRSPQRSHEPRSSRPRAPPKGKAPTPPIPSAYTQVAEEHYQSRSAAVSAWQAAATADGKQIVTVKQSGGNYVNLVCREAHVTPKEKRAQADKENVEGNVA